MFSVFVFLCIHVFICLCSWEVARLGRKEGKNGGNELTNNQIKKSLASWISFPKSIHTKEQLTRYNPESNQKKQKLKNIIKTSNSNRNYGLFLYLPYSIAIRTQNTFGQSSSKNHITEFVKIPIVLHLGNITCVRGNN